MKFTPTTLPGVYVIDIEPIHDERGFFARSWCKREFAAIGLNTELVQCSMSFNEKKGTLRGLHYQVAPHEEVKTVRCMRGAVWDVVVDLRRDSQTRFGWFGLELSQENNRMLYVPEGFAHGLYTLRDESEVFYMISREHHPEAARGVRWDDPVLNIQWPGSPTVITRRDLTFALLGERT